MTQKKFELSSKDKTKAKSGYGYDFHHAEPQRRVRCMMADLLCPASADDIPPITQEAMTSVEAALELLANLIGDRDHCLYMGDADRDGKCTNEAFSLMSARRALAGILRVLPADPSAVVPLPESVRALAPRNEREAWAVHRALTFYTRIASELVGPKDDRPEVREVVEVAERLLGRAEAAK